MCRKLAASGRVYLHIPVVYKMEAAGNHLNSAKLGTGLPALEVDAYLCSLGHVQYDHRAALLE